MNMTFQNLRILKQNCQLLHGHNKEINVEIQDLQQRIVAINDEMSQAKALYMKLLEVFCKFEDKLVRSNQ